MKKFMTAIVLAGTIFIGVANAGEKKELTPREYECYRDIFKNIEFSSGSKMAIAIQTITEVMNSKGYDICVIAKVVDRLAHPFGR